MKDYRIYFEIGSAYLTGKNTKKDKGYEQNVNFEE